MTDAIERDDYSTRDELHEHDHLAHGGVGVGVYVMVAVGLLILTFMSYWTYTPLWPFGENIAIKRIWMMAVSCTKAMLVILFFMHLKWEANWKWVLTVPASLMAAFLVIALIPDIGMRMKHASYERMIYAAERPPLEATDDAHRTAGHTNANAKDEGMRE